MRKARIILAVALAVIVAILGVAWLLFHPNRFRGQIEARLEQQLGRKVELGDMGIGLFPIRLTVENLRIAEDSRFKSELPFTQTERLNVRVALSGLISGNINVESVELLQPKVELIRNESSVWNFSSLSRKDAPSQTASADSAADPAAASGFSLKRLAIKGANIAVTDLLNKKARTVYGPIDISLTDYAAGKPFTFEVAAHLPGENAQEIRINGETTIDRQPGKLTANGKLQLKNPNVGGVDIGYPIVLDYRVSSDLDRGLVEIPSATLQLGPTPLALTGSINMNPNPATVDLRLTAGGAQITEVARLASAFGIAFARDTSVAGRLNGSVRAQGPIDRIVLNGSLAGRDLQISGKTVPQPVHVRAVNVTFTPSEIRSDEFEASSGKTTAFGSFTVRDYSSKNAWMDLALRAPGATLPEVQAIARAYGLKGLDQLSGAGNVSFDLRASGPLESVASANIAQTLNGTMNLDFNTVRIQGFDASRELGRIGGFLNSEQADKGYSEVISLAGRINVKNGVAETTDLHAQLLEGTLLTTGSSDLSSQTLTLRAMAVFSKAFSDKVGGTRVGGYLTTVLSNEKGEIVIPVLISGDIRKPKFQPDTKTFLQLQKQRLLPGLLDRITGGEINQAEPGKEESKPGGLKGILRGIFK